MNWINLPDNISDYFGIVYLITNISPDLPEDEPKYYIGCKQILRKVRLKRKNKRDKIVYKDNKMEDYWGSSNELLTQIEKYKKENYTREILHLCKSKWSMKYHEALEQFDRKVLFDKRYFNGIINLRIGRVPKSYLDFGC